MVPKRLPRGPKRLPRASRRAPRGDFEGFGAQFLEVLGHCVGIFLEFALDMFGLQVLHMSRFMCFFTFLTFLAWGGYSKAEVRGGVKPSPGLGFGLFGDPNDLYTPGGSVASAD